MMRWLWLPAYLLLSCDASLSSTPKSCARSPAVCARDEFCSSVTQLCETLDCSRNEVLCTSHQYCDPASHRCLATTCVQEPTQCRATEACNPATGQCETRSFVLGQPDAKSNLNLAYGMFNPRAVLLVADGGSGGKSKLLVADASNQRVLIWNEVPSVNRPADAVLGQPDVHTTNAAGPYGGVNERSLSAPWGLAGDGTQILVADQQLNRVLIWNKIPSLPSGGEPYAASALWGQPDFLSSLPNAGQPVVNELGVSAPRIFGNASVGYFVSDSVNHRVLAFKSAPRSFADRPDFVIGQPDFTTNQPSTSASGLRLPRAVYCDATTLFVSDFANNRILGFSPAINANAPTATMVFGQATFTTANINQGGPPTDTSLYAPVSLWVVSGATRLLFVADQGNNRVLRYTLPSTRADLVLGQANFTSNSANRGGAAAANTINFPVDVASDGTRLVVADPGNNRVLIWNPLPTQNGQRADVVLGQPDEAGTLSNQPPSLSGLSFRDPGYVYSDGVRLLIADTGNHRVLLWNQLPLDGSTPPDVVLGQPDFVSRFANSGLSAPTASTLANPHGIAIEGGRLLVADTDNNRILIWNQIPTQNAAPAELVIGQTNRNTKVAQAGTAGLYAPFDIRFEQGRLYAADAGNNRVLIFNAPFASGATANVVLGQPNFTSTASGLSATSFKEPRAVFLAAGKLLVVDRNNHRVLVWNRVPTSNNAAADVVVGQPDFTSATPRNDRTRLYAPAGLVVKDGRLFVASGGQNRVLYWNQIPQTNGYRADGVLGQGEFLSASPNNPDLPPIDRLSHPVALAATADQLFIADDLNHRVVVRGWPR